MWNIHGTGLSKQNHKLYIQYDTGLCERIDPETLCQFTGLYDKNGKEVYEGDVVKCWEPYFDYGGIKDEEFIKKVHYDENMYIIPCHTTISYEVIGNIYDNPELIESQWSTYSQSYYYSFLSE